MKRRSLILMILIVLLPIALLTWFGLRIARDEQSLIQQRFRSVMGQRLDDVNRVVTERFSETERRLNEITALDDFDVSTLREVVRREPQVTQIFVLRPDGALQYPNPADALNGTELSFLQKAARMFTDRDLQNAVTLAESNAKGDSSLDAFAAGADGSMDIAAVAVPSLPAQADQSPLSMSRAAGPNNLAKRTPSEDSSGSRKNDVALAASPPGSLDKSRAMRAEKMSDRGTRPMDLPVASADGVAQAVPLDAVVENSPEAMVAKEELMAASQNEYLLELREQPGEATEEMIKQLDQSRPFFPSKGWFVWYWDRGLNLIYWQRRPSGHIVGAALERSRWISDLISWLPETAISNKAESGEREEAVQSAFRVMSSSAEVVYEWGHDVSREDLPFCECSLAAPLASWRLQCFVPASQVNTGSGRGAFLGFAAGMSAFAMTLTALAWLLYRDYSRDMREASQQVSFVNQVSHELKTPLTNIRLYADLLERDLEQVATELSEKPLRRLSIISSEAQRLSRLIGNVLTFARQHRNTLQAQPAKVDVTELVTQIAERFAPSLQNHGVEVSVTGQPGTVLNLDADFVEQIIGNLISNVEKYGASGKLLTIRTSVTDQEAVIDVIDNGPGIAEHQRAALFRPFSRLSRDLRASTGTGIGLSITRDLARLHGGDVILKESETGCWFQVRLKSLPSPMQNEGVTA
jgi:signal transduction histidine kinase